MRECLRYDRVVAGFLRLQLDLLISVALKTRENTITNDFLSHSNDIITSSSFAWLAPPSPPATLFQLCSTPLARAVYRTTSSTKRPAVR